jgi:hypothetical protein
LVVNERFSFGDFYVIPAQFGISHRGRSIRRALEMIEFCPDLNFFEFGLGIFEIGAMLLTHPTRIHLGSHGKNKDNLSMYCAGNVYDPKGNGKFHFVPWYLIDGYGNLSVGYRLNDGECLGSVGTPSAFLPMPKQK